jgi:membrane protease YdiL (CAAX protease family)
MKTKAATIVTLSLAIVGPPLIAIISQRVLGESASVVQMAPFDALYWALFAVVLAVIIYVEKEDLSSIGLRRPSVSTIVWAIVLVCGINFLLSPAAMWVVNKAGLSGYEFGLSNMARLPVWYKVFLAISAGVIEETLYRGYAIERLASLTGSYWVGGAIAAVAFSLSHLPAWGIGPSLVFLVATVVTTLFYIWKRDLLALILAHAIGDTIGLVVLPPAF